MVKRISCRVISTAAFSKTSAGSPSVKQMNNRRHESSGDAAADISSTAILAVFPRAGSPCYAMGILNDFPIGQILDCYA